MRLRIRWRVLLIAAATVPGSACRSPSRPATDARREAPATSVRPATPLVLAAAEGERRVRRLRPTDSSALSAPFILKVDGRNGGSADLVMGTEDIPPGQGITPHRHLVADEIIFVHSGTGVVSLGERESAFGPGATIYIPKNVRIAVRNTGATPLSIVFVFSKPGFEAYLRDTSVPEGEPVTPLSSAERAVIRARHQGHTRYDQP